jgi:hypothetical protein
VQRRAGCALVEAPGSFNARRNDHGAALGSIIE